MSRASDYIPGGGYEEPIDAFVWESIASFSGQADQIDFDIPNSALYDRIEITGRARSTRINPNEWLLVFFNDDLTRGNYYAEQVFSRDTTTTITEYSEPMGVLAPGSQSPTAAFNQLTLVIDKPSEPTLRQAHGTYSLFEGTGPTRVLLGQGVLTHTTMTAALEKISIISNTLVAIEAEITVRGLRRRSIGNRFISHNPSVDNLVINGDFRVNQRNGTRNPGIGVYGYDRWKGHADGLEQVVEGSGLPGGSLCLSWQGGGTASIDGGAASASPVVASYVGNSNISVVVPSNATDVKLEYGTEPTAFRPRAIGEEWALCYRYFWKSDGSSIPVFMRTSTSMQGSVMFPMPMRTIPTVTGTTVGTVFIGATTVSLSAFDQSYTTTTQGSRFAFNTGVSSQGQAGAYYGGNLQADAEL